MPEHYRIHRFALAVEADDDAVAAALGRKLAAFRADGSAPDLPLLALRVVSSADGRPPPAPPAARPVYELSRGTVLFDDERDTLHLAWADRLALRLDCPRRRIDAWHVPGAAERLTVLPRLFLTLALIEIAKRHGLFAVHAATVARAGRAAILAGTSGSGKSTLAFALAGAGFDLLGDDLVWLEPRGADLPRLLAFPAPIDLDPAVRAWFPGARLEPPGEGGKCGVDPAAIGARIAWEATPVALVFPRIGATQASSICPVTTGEALLAIAPDVLLTDRVASQAHLDAIGALVRATPAYRLECARDFTAIAVLVAGILGADA